jgi:tetratricopeptide (TPR) repeat protein
VLRSLVALLLLATAGSLPALAGSANNSILGEPPKRTPYGLKIVRGNDDRRGEPENELPIAGLSLGRYLQSIENAEQGGGAYADGLAEPLQDLGRAYQAEAKHPEAMDFFTRALHLSRINEGLYSESQLPLLGYMIESHMAMGQLGAVDNKQSYRFRMQQRIYEAGDPELMEATLEYSEWQRQAYLDGFSGNTYRRIVDIHNIQSKAVEQLAEKDPNDPRIIPHLYERMEAEYLVSQYDGEKEDEFQVNITNSMEAKFALSTDLSAQRFQYLREFNYRNGIKTMQRIIDVQEAQEYSDPMELARAKIALGDWYMWWDTRARAMQAYEEAWAILEGDGSDLTDPDALFTQPVELPEVPVFHPGTITPVNDERAHATILFNVSRAGRARDVRVVQQNPPDNMGARVALFDMMKEMRFRPIVREGKVVLTENVIRDYRYEYQRAP